MDKNRQEWTRTEQTSHEFKMDKHRQKIDIAKKAKWTKGGQKVDTFNTESLLNSKLGWTRSGQEVDIEMNTKWTKVDTRWTSDSVDIVANMATRDAQLEIKRRRMTDQKRRRRAR